MEENRVQFLVFDITIGTIHIIINLHSWYAWHHTTSNPYYTDKIVLSPDEVEKLHIGYKEGNHHVDDSCSVNRQKKLWHSVKILCFTITYYWTHHTRFYRLHPSGYHFEKNPIDFPKPPDYVDLMQFPG